MAQIRNIKSKTVHRYLLEFDQLILGKGSWIGFMKKMGKSTINVHYQLNNTPKLCGWYMTNHVIRQLRICYHLYVSDFTGAHCYKMSSIR